MAVTRAMIHILQRLKQWGATMSKGLCMGAADIVPGVSGGTMALILGIYPRLLKAIKSVNMELAGLIVKGRIRDAARHMDLALLMPLAMGIVCAFLFFTHVVPLPRLVREQTELVYAVFFGLIAGSVLVLVEDIPRKKLVDGAWVLLGIAAGLAWVTMTPMALPDSSWMLFLSGMLAISAMLLPGISGSFVLLILGKYALILEALATLDGVVLTPFILGTMAGLVVFSRAIGWLLEHYRRRTMEVIIGMLIGSLYAIWPYQERVVVSAGGKDKVLNLYPIIPSGAEDNVAVVFALVLCGFSVVWILSWLQAMQGTHKQRAAHPGYYTSHGAGKTKYALEDEAEHEKPAAKGEKDSPKR